MKKVIVKIILVSAVALAVISAIPNTSQQADPGTGGRLVKSQDLTM